MQKQQPSRRLSLGLMAGISVLVLAVGGGTVLWAVNSLTSSPKTPPEPIVRKGNNPNRLSINSQEQTAQVYWLDVHDNKTELVGTPITTDNTNDPNKILASAIGLLLAGPEGDLAYTTTIPEGTKLLDLNVKGDAVYINLSQEFTSGGGSEAMIDRLGQILYTTTTLNPESKVWIQVEGKPLETLGGEGVEVAQPLTRQEFNENFSL